jgi:hypothetical protein
MGGGWTKLPAFISAVLCRVMCAVDVVIERQSGRRQTPESAPGKNDEVAKKLGLLGKKLGMVGLFSASSSCSF